MASVKHYNRLDGITGHKSRVGIACMSQEKGNSLIAMKTFTKGETIDVGRIIAHGEENEWDLLDSVLGSKEVLAWVSGGGFSPCRNDPFDEWDDYDDFRLDKLLSLYPDYTEEFILEINNIVRSINVYCPTMATGKGRGISEAISYANHNCNPTAYDVYNKKTKLLHMIAARDVREGEEITISYCPNVTHNGDNVMFVPYVTDDSMASQDVISKIRTYMIMAHKIDCRCSVHHGDI